MKRGPGRKRSPARRRRSARDRSARDHTRRLRSASGEVHRYYAFDAAQNGGTLRVIVLDNSEGSLEESERASTHGSNSSCRQAQLAHLPVVVVTAHAPAKPGSDPEGIASLLASSGVRGGVHDQRGAAHRPGRGTARTRRTPSDPRKRPLPGCRRYPSTKARRSATSSPKQRRDVVLRLDQHRTARPKRRCRRSPWSNRSH